MLFLSMVIADTIILVFTQWFPTRTTSVPQGSLGNVCKHFWVSQVGVLLHPLQSTGQPPQHRIILLKGHSTAVGKPWFLHCILGTEVNSLYMISFYMVLHLYYILYTQRKGGARGKRLICDHTACKWWSPGTTRFSQTPKPTGLRKGQEGLLCPKVVGDPGGIWTPA